MTSLRAILLGVVLASAGCLTSGGDPGTKVDTHGTGGAGSGGDTGAGGGGHTGGGSGMGSGGGGGGDPGDGSGDGGDGGTNVCHVTQNDHEIECTDGACVCSVAGHEVSRCTAPDPSSACSSPGNCCGF